MTNKEGLYQKAQRSPKNFSYRDLCLLVKKIGFSPRKTKSGGSHNIYNHPDIAEIINLQPPKNGKLAKPYQVRQVLNIIDQYGLIGGDT